MYLPLSGRPSFSKIRDYVNVILIGSFPSLAESLNTYGFLVFSTVQCDDCYCISEETLATHVESWNSLTYLKAPTPLPEPLRGKDGPVLVWLNLICRIHLQGSRSLDAFQKSFARQSRPSQTFRRKPKRSTKPSPVRSEMIVPLRTIQSTLHFWISFFLHTFVELSIRRWDGTRSRGGSWRTTSTS